VDDLSVGSCRWYWQLLTASFWEGCGIGDVQVKEAELALQEIEGVSSLNRRFQFSDVRQSDVKFYRTSSTSTQALRYAEIGGRFRQSHFRLFSMAVWR